MIIDTPEGLAFFRLLQYEGRFKVEISTGLRHRQPTLKLYNMTFGTKFRRKEAALEDVQRRIQEAKDARIQSQGET